MIELVVCFQVIKWIEEHGETFLLKHTGVGKSLVKAEALLKRHEEFESIAQVSLCSKPNFEERYKFSFCKMLGKKVGGESTSEEISFECMVIVAPVAPRAQCLQ